MTERREPLDLERVRERLDAHRPRLARPLAADETHAAVALLLAPRAAADCELLFIERSIHERDKWSGHVAFPGGKMDPEDPEIERTARREVEEEIGIQLGSPIGRLDDFDARTSARSWPLVVSPFVYALPDRPDTTLNHEVNDVLWVRLGELLTPASAARHELSEARGVQSFPAVRHREFVIWGMTYRMLANFFGLFELSLPVAPPTRDP